MQQELTATVRSVGDSDARDGSNVAEVHGPPGCILLASVCAGPVAISTRLILVQSTRRVAIPSRGRLRGQKLIVLLRMLPGKIMILDPTSSVVEYCMKIRFFIFVKLLTGNS